MTPVRELFVRLSRNVEARIVLAFSAGTLLFAMVGNRLLTEWADPGELGVYYMYMNVAQWLAIPAVGAYHFIFRYWITAKHSDASASFFRLVAAGLAAEAVLAAIATAILARTDDVLPREVLVAIWFTGVAQAAAQAVAPVPASERRRVIVGLMTFIATPLRYFVLAGAIRIAGVRSGTGLMWVQAAYALIAGACAWGIFAASVEWRQSGKIRSVLTRGVAREVLTFSGPYVATGALMQLCASAERWGLARLDSPAATALFVLSVGLSTAAARALGAPLLMYFQPLVTQAASAMDADGVQRLLRRLAATTTALMALAAVGLAILAPFVATIFFGKQYSAIASILPWTAVGACAFELGQALAMYPYAGRDALSPNVAHGISLAVYALALIAYRPTDAAALEFARVYAVTSVGYAAAMAFVALRWARRFGELGAKSLDDAADHRAAM